MVDSFGKIYMKIVLFINKYFSVIVRIKLKTIMIEIYQMFFTNSSCNVIINKDTGQCKYF